PPRPRRPAAGAGHLARPATRIAAPDRPVLGGDRGRVGAGRRGPAVAGRARRDPDPVRPPARRRRAGPVRRRGGGRSRPAGVNGRHPVTTYRRRALLFSWL